MKKEADCEMLSAMRKPSYMPRLEWERMLQSFPHLTMADRFAAEQFVELMVKRRKLQAIVDEEGDSEDGKMLSPAAKRLEAAERLFFQLNRELGGTPKARNQKVLREDRSSVPGSEFFRS